ncbi:MAG: 5-oxoprolinase subunit PxpB [Lachnospiraceae bacterium]|nr:5-oxoprolinase subunit PxpB [Lachnospiraceae bacterium]
MSEFRMCPVGDQAILCEFGNKIDEKINDEVQALTRQIKSASFPGVVEILPTYRSLLVFYDSSQISYKKLSKKIGSFHRDSTGQEAGSKKIRIVPCLYGGEYGPDLSDMADQLGMSEAEIINIHKSVDYKIYMLGFLPGFVYLGGLDERIHMPRLDVPRTKIPERSVGIGGNQTGVYPMESPGGWRLIGSTPLNFYNPASNPPVLCEAGEYIRFEPVTKQEYERIRKDVERGSYRAEFV